jgi:hypothetical protein
MSIRQILQVWEHEFSQPHQCVMLALADHAHEDGTGIRPSIQRLVWKTGYSERSVQSIMSQLRALGILVIAVPATHVTPNEYRFDWSVATPKPSFDHFMTQKRGHKSRGADFAPLSKESRGAVAGQGCNRDAAGVQLRCERGAVVVQEGCSPLHPIRPEPLREPSEENKESDFQVGVVNYQQPSSEIDLAELWERNLGMAKHQVRFLAPGHKRPEMVAHGLGQWWVGPGLNDFDEHLIQACQQRKRKFQQSDSVGDAKTYLNNMLRNGDWANLLLRCEEAILLRERAVALPVARAMEPSAADCSPFERSSAERRESALGLARFKLSQGLMDQAWAISQQFDLTPAELGLLDRDTEIFHWPQAA